MKILVAASGNTLSDRTARRFGDAAFFLFVDTETNKFSSMKNNGSQALRDALFRASEEQIRVIITGGIDFRSVDIIASLNLEVAIARNLTISEAIGKWVGGEVKVQEMAALRRMMEKYDYLRITRRFGGNSRNSKGQGANLYRPVTPRGRHHLQQFGGRGH